MIDSDWYGLHLCSLCISKLRSIVVILLRTTNHAPLIHSQSSSSMKKPPPQGSWKRYRGEHRRGYRLGAVPSFPVGHGFWKVFGANYVSPRNMRDFYGIYATNSPPPPQKKEGLNKNRLSSWHHPFSDASASSFHGGYFLSTQDDRIHTCDRSILGFHVQVNLIVYPPEN